VALAWATLAYRLHGLWRHLADPRLRYLCVVLAVVAGGLTLEFAPVSEAVDRLAGMPNVTLLLGDLLTVAGCWATCALTAHLRHPDRRARQLAHRFGLLSAAALAVLIGCFLVSPRLPEQTDYWARYGGAQVGLLSLYRAVRSGFLALCAGYLVLQCRVFVRSSLRPSTRLGFGLLMAAGIGAELYVANDLVMTLPARLGLGWLARPPSIFEILVASLALVGLTLPSWGPRTGVDAALTWIADYGSLLRLYPLWRRLCEAAPVIAMVPPRGRLSDLLDPSDVHFRLYRRVVEIRDGMLLLAAGQDEPGARGPAGQDASADLRAEARALERLARSYPASSSATRRS
jgi:hypothetical protein